MGGTWDFPPGRLGAIGGVHLPGTSPGDAVVSTMRKVLLSVVEVPRRGDRAQVNQ